MPKKPRIPDRDKGKDIIILARHGEPALNKNVRINWRGYKYWWRLYDEGGLKDSSKAPLIIKDLADQADIVVSSPLLRAVETAERASGRAPDMIIDELEEAPLPPPNLGYFRFKPRVWGVLSRISWMLGFSGEGESAHEARKRAKVAALKLSDLASGGTMVFVAAHGWFNRMLRPELKKLNFKVTEDHGDLHWSYRRYERDIADEPKPKPIDKAVDDVSDRNV